MTHAAQLVAVRVTWVVRGLLQSCSRCVIEALLWSPAAAALDCHCNAHWQQRLAHAAFLCEGVDCGGFKAGDHMLA